MAGTLLESENDTGVGAILAPMLQKMRAAAPALTKAVLCCAVPRWFDRQIAAGICGQEDSWATAESEIFKRVQSLPFCELHPSRASTWAIRREFRSYFLTLPEVAARLPELQARAVETFKRILDGSSLTGERRFQDEDWRLVATEWLYHLLQVDPDGGLAAATRMCAEALSVPVYKGPSWEIDFCVRLLADLEWPPGIESLDSAFGNLRKGFGDLAAGRNARALPMVKELAEVPGLTPRQAGELHYFAGTTHLWDEGRLGPALEELQEAAACMPNHAGVHGAIAAVHYTTGTSWGRLDKAEESAREAIRVEPNQAEGYVALGRIYEQLEDWDRAIAQYIKGIEVEPDDTDGYLALSDAYVSRRQVPQAIELIDKAWKLDPRSEYYGAIRKGNAYAGARDFDNARREYEQAIALGPDQPATYIALGGFYELLWQFSEAEEQYNKAIEWDPASEDGYVALAKLYEGQGKRQKALDTRQGALAKGVVGKGLYIGLCDVYQQQERLADLEAIQTKMIALDPAEQYASYCATADAVLSMALKRKYCQEQPELLARARKLLDQAIEEDKNRAWAYLSMGALHVLAADFDKLAEVEQLMARCAQWGVYDLLVRLGQACLQAYQRDRGQAFLNRAVELAPGKMAGWLALGDLYGQLGDPRGVAEAWAQVVQIDPARRYDAQLARAGAYLSVQDYQRAREEYSEAAAAEPGIGDAYFYLGRVAEAANDSQEAIAQYQAAADRASGWAPVALTSIAAVLKKDGKLSEAEKTLRRAIVLDPDYSESYFELARLGVAWGRKALVEQACERIEATAPDETYELYRTLGEAYCAVGGYENAREAYDHCRELDPLRADAYVGLAQVTLEHDEGELSTVRKEVTQALEVDPTSVDAYVMLSRLCEAENDAEGVIAAQQRIVELAPIERYSACLNIGEVYEKATQMANAEQKHREALEMCPWRPDAYLALGSLLTSLDREGEVEKLFEKAKAETGFGYLDLGQYLASVEKAEEAFKAFDLGIKHEPAEAQADLYRASAQLHSRLGQIAEAGHNLRQAIALAPDRADAYTQLAQLLYDEEGPSAAVQVYRQMAEQASLAYLAHLLLGDLWAGLEKPKEAAREYRQAIKLDPQQQDGYLGLAQLYQQQEMLDQAEALIQEARRVAPDSPDPVIVLSRLRERQGRVDDAIELYRQVAKLKPAEASAAHERIGDLLIGKERFEEALAALQQAVQQDPANAGAYFSLGTIYERRANPEPAIGMYSKAIEANPKYLDPYVALGRVYRGQGNKDALRQLVQQLVKLDLEQAQYEGHLAKADLYEALDETESARASCEQAMALEPQRGEAYVMLLRLLAAGKRWDEATRVCYRMAKQPQLTYNAFISLANVLTGKEDYEGAEKAYRQAIELAPGNPDGYVQLAQLLVERNQVEAAARVYRKLARQPGLAYLAQLLLGDMWAGLEAYEKAEKAYRQAIKLDPQQQGGYLQLAQLYQQQEMLSEAEAQIEEARRIAPDSPDPVIVLSRLREQQDRVDEAIELYRQVAKLKPTEASAAYERIGDLLIGKERFEEALTALRQAVEQDPANAGAHYSLGTIYERQTNLEEATSAYSKAIEADPKYFGAYAGLWHIYGQQGKTAQIAQLGEQLLAQRLEPAEKYDAHMAIGAAYNEANALEWSVNEFRAARQILPQRPDACLALGQIYELQRRWADAREIYGKLDEIVPEWQVDVHLKLADLYWQEGASREVEQELRRAIALGPERREAYATLAQLYMIQEQWAQAAEQWEQIARLKDIEPIETCSALLYLADTRRALGDRGAMLAACSEVISRIDAITAPSSDLLRQKGLALFMQGKYEEAAGPLKLCLEAAPGDAKAHFYLALNLLCQGNLGEANQQFERGLAEVKEPNEYDSATREAKVLAAAVPEIAGAKEILDRLTAAASDGTP